MTYTAHRDHRWEYAYETVQHIERRNCAMGCVHGDPGSEDEPGGSCEVLLDVILEQPTEELEDDGVNLTCKRFEAVE